MNSLCKALAAILIFASSPVHAGSTHPGGVNGDIQVNQSGNFGPLTVGSGLTLTPGSPPTLSAAGGASSAAAAPTGSCSSGAIYYDTSNLTQAYICVSSAWVVSGFPNVASGWNPSTVDACTISGSNNTIVTAAGGDYNYGQVFAWPPKASGKRYFEIVMSTGSFAAVGIVYNTYPGVYRAQQGNLLGLFPNQIGWSSDGTVRFNSVTLTSIQSWAGTNTLGIATDFDAGLIWFRTNAGNWNNNGSADPATDTGGIFIQNIPGSQYYVPAANLGGSPGATGTINLGTASFAQSVPSGYSSWIH